MTPTSVTNQPPDDLRRLSHDFKNALNGVSVNLEVLRSRIGRIREEQRSVEASEVEALTPYLNNAAERLEAVTQYGKTLLALIAEWQSSRGSSQ